MRREALGATSDDLALGTSSSTPPARDADVYFDEIDKAFAALSRAPRAPLPVTDVHLGADVDADDEHREVADEREVLESDGAIETQVAALKPAEMAAATAPSDIEQSIAAPVSSPLVSSPPLVSVPAPPIALSDAFAALLEAEGSDDASRLRVSSGVSSAAPAVDPSALADQVTRRVLEQLTDRVVRATVAEIVAATAERLVREEIERIKRDIK